MLEEARLYTISEAATYLGVATITIRSAVSRNRLAYVPGTKCFTQAVLDDYNTHRPAGQRIPVEAIDPLFWAWMAGFVDGEGCFHIARQRATPGGRPRDGFILLLIVTNTDPRPLFAIQETLRVGRVVAMQSEANQTRNQRIGGQYQVRGRHAQIIAGALRPYLRVKDQQADVFMAFPYPPAEINLYLPVPESIRQARAELYEEIRRLNHRGRGEYHPESEDDSWPDLESA